VPMRCFLTNCVLSISLFLTIALLPQISFAQSATGSLCGEVQDAAGRRVPAATVTVEARGSGLSRAVKADERGEFRMDDLLPGPYSIVVRPASFADASSTVDIASRSRRARWAISSVPGPPWAFPLPPR